MNINESTNSAEKRHSLLKNILSAYLEIVNKVSASTNTEIVMKLGNRTANCLAALNAYTSRSELVQYHQDHADSLPEYDVSYNALTDLNAIKSAVQAIKVLLLALDLSGAVSLNAQAKPVYNNIDTTSLASSIQTFKSLISV